MLRICYVSDARNATPMPSALRERVTESYIDNSAVAGVDISSKCVTLSHD